MARRRSEIEFLSRLVDWAGGNHSFCKLTGIHAPNLSSYLTGAKQVSWARLHKATGQVFGQPPAFCPLVEGYDLFERGIPNVSVVPNAAGLYALYDSAMRLLYYGKATSLNAEVRQTLRRHVPEVKPWTGVKNLTFRDIAAYLSAFRIERGDRAFRHDVEALGLRLFVNNTFNKNSGSFARRS